MCSKTDNENSKKTLINILKELEVERKNVN